jgi:hypothetical protein
VTGNQSSTSVVKVNGAAVPVSKTVVGTNSSGQLVDASSATLTNNTSGNAATATTATTANALSAGALLNLSAPSGSIGQTTAPTITQGGTAGSTNYGYAIVARNTAGTLWGPISPVAITLTGPATLSGTNYNIVTFPSLPTNANCFDVWRMLNGTSLSAEGLIAACQTTSYNDQGASATSQTPPYYPNWAPQIAGLPLGCLSYPCTIAKVYPSTYTGTVTTGFTLLTQPSTAGEYRLCYFIDVTTAASAGTVTGYGSFISDGHGFTPTLGAAVTATGQWNYSLSSSAPNCVTFYADASQPIKWEIFGAGVTGSPVFRYAVTLEQLQ